MLIVEGRAWLASGTLEEPLLLLPETNLGG
jgi:hypothetical protein